MVCEGVRWWFKIIAIYGDGIGVGGIGDGRDWGWEGLGMGVKAKGGRQESVQPYALRVSVYARLVVFIALQTAVNSTRR